GGPITAAQRKGTAAVREQDGAPAARRGGRPNLPVVLAAVVAAIAVVVGVAWAGSYFNGNGQDGQPVGDRENASPSSSPSATPSVDETPDEGVVDEGTGDGGYIPETGGDPLPPTDGQPTAPDTPVEPDPGQSTDPGGGPGTEEPPPPDDAGDPGTGGGGTEPGEGDAPGDVDGAWPAHRPRPAEGTFQDMSQPRLRGGRYELDAVVGRGGMAEVHRARDL